MTSQELYTPFRPVRARRVALGVAVTQGVVLAVFALVVPAEGPVGFQWPDRLGVLLLAAAIAWWLSRYLRLVAVPAPGGLTVRNLFLSRELEWAEIVAVRFGAGMPWVELDLSDGETMAVMAVQRADGDHGQSEARRLSTLVALHSRTERDD